MRLATAAVPSPVLRRQTIIIGNDDDAWAPLAATLEQSGIVSPSDTASALPAAIAFLSGLRAGARRKVETAIAANAFDIKNTPSFTRPVDDRAKVMVVGGWNPVSRPDLELDHVTPHVMARWMDAEDFRRPPITVFKKFPSAIADPEPLADFAADPENDFQLVVDRGSFLNLDPGAKRGQVAQVFR